MIIDLSNNVDINRLVEVDMHVNNFLGIWRYISFNEERGRAEHATEQAEQELHEEADWLEKNAPGAASWVYRTMLP